MAFKEFDFNGDGKIQTSDLGTCLRKLDFHPTIEEILEIIKNLDPDGDSYVEFDKFHALVKKLQDDDNSSKTFWIVQGEGEVPCIFSCIFLSVAYYRRIWLDTSITYFSMILTPHNLFNTFSFSEIPDEKKNFFFHISSSIFLDTLS